MRTRFLLDENLSPQIRDRAIRKYPHLDIACVGDTNCPPKGSSDELILRFVAETQRVLITRNRKSMPRHVQTIEGEGITHWGVFRIRAGTTFGQLIEELFLLSEASNPVEWAGKQLWLPL
jgi:hypothetical protein